MTLAARECFGFPFLCPLWRFFSRAAVTLAILVVSVLCSSPARAQGGPPFITDDPGTPGTNHWEINTGYIYNLDSSPGTSSYELPHIDLNYGWGPRIQLKYEVGLALLKLPGRPLTSGLSNSLAGVKYRFLDEDAHGFSMSTYPQLEFNNLTSSVRRGLAESGTQFFLPIEVARKIGKFETDAEVGYLVRSGDPDNFVYGGLAGRSLGERLELLVEFHGTFVRGTHDNEFLSDFGGRLQTSKHTNLLFMTGHSVFRIPNQTPGWFGYLGIQVVL